MRKNKGPFEDLPIIGPIIHDATLDPGSPSDTPIKTWESFFTLYAGLPWVVTIFLIYSFRDGKDPLFHVVVVQPFDDSWVANSYFSIVALAGLFSLALFLNVGLKVVSASCALRPYETRGNFGQLPIARKTTATVLFVAVGALNFGALLLHYNRLLVDPTLNFWQSGEIALSYVVGAVTLKVLAPSHDALLAYFLPRCFSPRPIQPIGHHIFGKLLLITPQSASLDLRTSLGDLRQDFADDLSPVETGTSDLSLRVEYRFFHSLLRAYLGTMRNYITYPLVLLFEPLRVAWVWARETYPVTRVFRGIRQEFGLLLAVHSDGETPVAHVPAGFLQIFSHVTVTAAKNVPFFRVSHPHFLSSRLLLSFTFIAIAVGIAFLLHGTKDASLQWIHPLDSFAAILLCAVGIFVMAILIAVQRQLWRARPSPNITVVSFLPCSAIAIIAFFLESLPRIQLWEVSLVSLLLATFFIVYLLCFWSPKFPGPNITSGHSGPYLKDILTAERWTLDFFFGFRLSPLVSGSVLIASYWLFVENSQRHLGWEFASLVNNSPVPFLVKASLVCATFQAICLVLRTREPAVKTWLICLGALLGFCRLNVYPPYSFPRGYVEIICWTAVLLYTLAAVAASTRRPSRSGLYRYWLELDPEHQDSIPRRKPRSMRGNSKHSTDKSFLPSA